MVSPGPLDSVNRQMSGDTMHSALQPLGPEGQIPKLLAVPEALGSGSLPGASRDAGDSDVGHMEKQRLVWALVLLGGWGNACLRLPASLRPGRRRADSRGGEDVGSPGPALQPGPSWLSQTHLSENRPRCKQELGV